MSFTTFLQGFFLKILILQRKHNVSHTIPGWHVLQMAKEMAIAHFTLFKD